MTWFNKKNQEKDFSALPELPEIPDIPDTPPMQEHTRKKEELPALPSFPPSESANKISQEAIKSALDLPKKPYTQEIDSSFKERPMFKETEEKYSSGQMFQSIREVKPALLEKGRIEPVFVRIDKFQAALKNLHEIRKQVSDIEAYLAEIRQIKAKEEAELSEWAKEILEIKGKLDSLDKGIFSKLD